MVNPTFARCLCALRGLVVASGSLAAVCTNASAESDGTIDCAAAVDLVSKENTLEAYDRAVQQCPTNAALHYNRSLMLNNAGRTADAREAVDAAIGIQDDPRFRIAKAKILEIQGKRDEAAGEYESILKNDPANQQAIQGLASLGKAGSSSVDVDRALDEAKTPEALLAIGVAKLNRQDYKGASKAFQKVLELDPANTQARHNYAHALVKSQDFSSAEKYLRDARKKFPDDAILIGLLGDSLSSQNNFVEAENVYREAYRVSKSDPAIGRSLGLTLLKNKKFKDAASYLRTVVNGGQTDAETESALGFAYLSSDKLADAEKAFRRALSKEPNHAGTYNNLGMLYFKQGKMSEAKESFEKAIAINPALSEAKSNLAEMEKKKK